MFVFCFAAGVALGIAWLTKFAAVFIVPVVLLALARLKRRRLSACLWDLAGFAVVVAFEMVFWAVMADQPLARFQVLMGSAWSVPSTTPFAYNSLWEYPLKMFIIISEDGLFYYFLAPALVWALFRRARQLWLPIFWVVCVFLCLQFGSSSFSRYQPFPHIPRYLMLLIPAGALLIGGSLSSLFRRRRRAAQVLFCFYALPSIFLAYLAPLSLHSHVVAAEAATEILRKEKAREVFSNPDFAQILSYTYIGANRENRLPQVRSWLDDNLDSSVILDAHPGAWVVRFDPSIRRALAGQGRYGDANIDQAYAWLEQNARKEQITLRYGSGQRLIMKWMWVILRRMPLPKSVHRRLKSAFSRHTAELVVILYHIGQRPEAVSVTSPEEPQ